LCQEEEHERGGVACEMPGSAACARCVNDDGKCILKTYNYCNTLIKEKNKHEDQPDNSEVGYKFISKWKMWIKENELNSKRLD